MCVDQSTKSEKAETEEKDEQYMSSKQWLQIYGLAARKLNLYDVLCGVSFKHQDGVVEILERPDGEQTDAVSILCFVIIRSFVKTWNLIVFWLL